MSDIALSAPRSAPVANDGASTAALIGRLFMAAIFLISGYGKAVAAGGTIAYIEAAGLPAPALAYAVALIVEIGGGLLLIAGYQTRLVAAMLAAFTLAAAAGFHADFGDQNQTIHFLKNVAMAGGLLQLVAFGAGRLGLDARR
jgi:putative oxidoreductase